MSTINFTALGLTGTGLVVQSGAEAFNKFSSGTPGFVVQKSDTTCVARSLIGVSGIQVTNATGDSGDANIAIVGPIDIDAAITSTQITVDGSAVSGYVPSKLNYHEESLTHTTNFQGIWASAQTGAVKVSRTGTVVNITIQAVLAVANTAATITMSTVLPAKWRPLYDVMQIIQVRDNATEQAGTMQIIASTGAMTIYATPGGTNFAGAGSSGFQPLSITYQAG